MVADPAVDGDTLLGGALVAVALVVAGYIAVQFRETVVAVAGPLFSVAFVVGVVLFLRGGGDV